MTTKVCNKCCIEKPLDAFSPAKHVRDGRVGHCRQCNVIIERQRRRTPEYLAAKAERAEARRIALGYKKKTPHEQKLLAERHKRRRAKDPAKIAARNAIQRLVRMGRVIKPTDCSSCRKTFPVHLIQAHHEDYSKPLEITWLCKDCHIDIHARQCGSKYSRKWVAVPA